MEALGDASPDVARAAIRRLVEIEGRRAAGVFTARLLVADLSLVADLAGALRDLGDPIALEVATIGLHDAVYGHRLAAALALGVLGDRRGIDALRSVLDDPIAGVRAAALDALVKLRPPDDVAVECATLLADPDAQVRIAAVRAVVAIVPRSKGLLGPLAADADCRVRLEVARHVAALAAEWSRRLFGDADAGVRQAAAQASGPAQATALASLLASDPNSDVRRAAARALGAIKAEAVAEALVAGVEDPDALVRAAVVHALERSLTRAGAVSRLTRELAAREPQRRRWTVYALAHLKASDAACDVWRLADDPEPDVRLALIQACSVVLADPEPLLLYMATDPDHSVQSSARNRLERHQRPGEAV